MAAQGYGLLATSEPSRGESDVTSLSPTQLEFEAMASQETTPLNRLKLLWQTGLTPGFLKSSGSRRELWRTLLPLLGLSFVALNSLAGSGVASLLMHANTEGSASLTIRRLVCFSDVAMLVGLLGASRLPADKLWSDLIIMAIMGIYGIACSLLAKPAEAILDVMTATQCIDFYRVLVVFVFASSGVHPCAIGGYLLMSAMALPILGAGHELLPLVVGFVAFLLSGVCYVHALRLFRDLQDGHAARTNDLRSVGSQTDFREVYISSSDQRTSATGDQRSHAASDQQPGAIPAHLVQIANAAQRAKEREREKEARAKEGRGDNRDSRTRELESSFPIYESEVALEPEVRDSNHGTEGRRHGSENHGTEGRRHGSDRATNSYTMGDARSLLTEESGIVQLTSPEAVHNQESGATGLTPVSWLTSSGTQVSSLSSLAYTVSTPSGASGVTFGPSRRKRMVVVCDQGVQTETNEQYFLICQRCLKPPSLPITANFSARSSRESLSDKQIQKLISGRRSARSSTASSSVLRLLGQLSRIPTSSFVNDSAGNPNIVDMFRPEAINEAEPLVSSFQVTRSESVSLSIQWAMKHWSLPRISGSCCPWHTALLLARTAIEELISESCDPLWSSIMDWQCLECTCLNHWSAKQCNMCQVSRTSSHSGSTTEQPSTSSLAVSIEIPESQAFDSQTGTSETHDSFH